MNSELIDEDAVDSEALQAQIDLSMSFAQNLISSWMEPHKFPTSSRRQNLEQELTEYMKRPPRLGVGAAVPEGMQSQTREVARLKGKLAGSKRSRDEDDLTPLKMASDEEGESRAGAIKKKARSDPFDVVHGKKKKKNKDPEAGTVGATPSGSPVHETKKKKKEDPEIANAQPTLPGPSSVSVHEANPNSSDEIERILNDPNESDISPVKNKKRKATGVPTEKISITRPSLMKNSSLDSPSTPSRSLTNEARIEVASPTKTPASRKFLPSELLKVPLLNLTGPPSDPESDCSPTTPSTSPKKKRKRRKKKKSHPLPSDTAENTDTNHHPTPTQ